MNNEERREGLIDMGSSGEDIPLALDLKEDDTLRIIGKRVEDGEAYWNKELDLDNVRKKSEKYYLGETYKEEDLYNFQVPYRNNRILTAVETLLPMVTSQIPLPVVTEGRDTDASRELANDLEDVLVAKYDDFGIRRSFTMVGRHILVGKRVGILKYRFDPDRGEKLQDGTRKGEIVVEAVRGEKVVFDANASDPDNIPLIAEYMEATIEELVLRFPKKKSEIFRHFGIARGVRSQLARKVGYMEVWFTYYDKEGNPQEAVAYRLSPHLLLGATKNPNWNYDEFEQLGDGKFRRLNYFDAPRKPYILVNHINLGKHVIDDTSLASQAQPLQDVLEKRGRQIVENADQAASGLVLNSNMISPDDARKLIGDPSEKIMVDGDVREAAARLPHNILPAYVINDKNDARTEIDNIYGANAPMRGEQTNNNTLGELVLSQRANSGRLQPITNAFEDACGRKYGLYPAMVQMMKVYWDEPEIVRFTPSDGKTRFIEWESDKVEDGVKVRVKGGSALPRDKQAIKNETIQLAPTLDPLSIAEGMDWPDAKKMATRIVNYRFFMDKYVSEDLADDGSDIDPNAMADLHLLTKGQTPPVPEEPSKRYIATIERFLQGGGFESIQDPQIKQNIIDFAKAVNEKAKEGLGEVGEPQSEQTLEAPLPAEQAGTVPVEGGQVPPQDVPPSPPEGTQGGGQNLFQRLVSRVRGQ